MRDPHLRPRPRGVLRHAGRSDDDLRGVIDTGSVAADELRTFIEENEVELGELINNLVTTGEVIVQHLDGVEQVLVLYPYVVEGGFTVVSKSQDTGLYDAHFGLIMQQAPPVCHARLREHQHPQTAGRQQRADERRTRAAPSRPRRARPGAQYAPRRRAREPHRRPGGGVRTTPTTGSCLGRHAPGAAGRTGVPLAPTTLERSRGSGCTSSPW